MKHLHIYLQLPWFHIAFKICAFFHPLIRFGFNLPKINFPLVNSSGTNQFICYFYKFNNNMKIWSVKCSVTPPVGLALAFSIWSVRVQFKTFCSAITPVWNCNAFAAFIYAVSSFIVHILSISSFHFHSFTIIVLIRPM